MRGAETLGHGDYSLCGVCGCILDMKGEQLWT